MKAIHDPIRLRTPFNLAVLRNRPARRGVPGQVQGRKLWHDERMVTLIRIALRLIEDALRWVLLLRSTESVQA